MKNYVERKQTVAQGRTNVYVRAGIDTESTDTGLMFSPYQMIPEVSVNWMLGNNYSRTTRRTKNAIGCY